MVTHQEVLRKINLGKGLSQQPLIPLSFPPPPHGLLLPPSLPPLPSFLRYQKNGPVSQTLPSPSLSFLLAPSAASDRKGEEGREETLPRATRPNGGGDRQQGDVAADGPFVRSLDDSTAVFLLTQRRSSRTQKEGGGIERKGQKEKEQQFVQITSESDPCSSSPDVPYTYILRKGLLRGSRQQWRREGKKVFAALTHQPSSGQKTGGGRGWLVGRFLLWVSNNGSGENFGVFPPPPLAPQKVRTEDDDDPTPQR